MLINKSRRWARLSLISSLAALFLAPGFAFAQEQDEELETYSVTGTRISRLDIETSGPVVSFDREAIDRTGYQTVSDVVRNLPYHSGFAFDEKFTNSFAPGSSGVSLRGLGQNATLVLLNGRRLTQYGFAQNITDSFVDLNSIPIGAIERIEILKTGASAIYGSDAIAGVINVITRRDLEGVTASATYSDTSKTDMSQFSSSVGAGVVGPRGNLILTVDYYRRSNLQASDRSFSEDADHSDREDGINYRSVWGNPGFIFHEGSFYQLRPADEYATQGRPTQAELLAGEPGLPSFNYAPWIDLIPRTERYSFAGIGEYDLFDNLTFFSELIYRKIETNQDAAPTPDTAFLDGRSMAADNPFNPFDVPLTYGYRYIDHGSRVTELDTDVARILVGLKGSVEDWNWETGALWNRSKTTNVGRNYHSDPAVRDALASTDEETALNIFDLNPHLRDDLTIETIRIGDSRMHSLDFFVDNANLIEVPAGSVGIAAGVEYRHEEVEDLADSFTTSGQVVASGGTSADGRRHLVSAYTEVVIPVVERVEFDAAVRFEDYSDFGNTTKPRFGVKVRALDDLLVRASIDRGFRAPSLAQLYLGESVSFPQVNDPKRPSDEGNQHRTVAGGNPDLQPETSEALYLGVVLEPSAIEGLSIAVDLSRIKHDNIIDDLGVGFILQNEDDLPGLVVRAPFENNPTDQAAGNTAGPIININNTYGNFGSVKTEHVDLEVNYDTTIADLGHFNFFTQVTYMADFKQQFRPGEDWVQRAGSNRFPQYRGTGGVTWTEGDWSSTLIMNYIHSFNDPSRDGRVGSFWELNPQVTYRGLWDTAMTLGVQNLLGRDPPWTSDTWEGYEFATHSPVGRRFYVRVAKDF